MDLVSVIIPYYKKKNHILETINSVINQTYKNIEILIIYDDEEKEDLNFLRQKFEQLDNLKIYVNGKNIGAGFSRNKGINLARGKYIAFIDADDIWMANKIERQVNFMKNKNHKISHTTYSVMDENKKILSLREARYFNNIESLIKSCDIGLSSVILEKLIINEEVKFANLRTKEDFVLWLKILSSGIEIVPINENLMIWKKTQNSLSGSVFQKLIDGYRVYNNYMKFSSIKSIYLLCCLSINYLKKK